MRQARAEPEDRRSQPSATVIRYRFGILTRLWHREASLRTIAPRWFGPTIGAVTFALLASGCPSIAQAPDTTHGPIQAPAPIQTMPAVRLKLRTERNELRESPLEDLDRDTRHFTVDLAPALPSPTVCRAELEVVAKRFRNPPLSGNASLRWLLTAPTEPTPNTNIVRPIPAKGQTAFSDGQYLIDPGVLTDAHGEPVLARGSRFEDFRQAAISFQLTKTRHISYGHSLACFLESGDRIARAVADVLTEELAKQQPSR